MADDVTKQREIAYQQLGLFVKNRIEYYTNPKKGVNLDKLLSKDVVMFAVRGVETSDEFAAEAFRAIESSSEETVMGNRWQAIIAAISSDTIDSGDLTTVRDDTVWVCELKCQRNTVNSASFPQELRELKSKLETQKRFRRASNQPMRPAYCILRSKYSIDEMRIYHPTDGDMVNRDINGFKYRYLEGKAFWQWLTGMDGAEGLIDDTRKIDKRNIVEARRKAIEHAVKELNDALDEHNLPHTIDGVLELKRILS